jgi:hypothetical protein
LKSSLARTSAGNSPRKIPQSDTSAALGFDATSLMSAVVFGEYASTTHPPWLRDEDMVWRSHLQPFYRNNLYNQQHFFGFLRNIQTVRTNPPKYGVGEDVKVF